MQELDIGTAMFHAHSHQVFLYWVWIWQIEVKLSIFDIKFSYTYQWRIILCQEMTTVKTNGITTLEYPLNNQRPSKCLCITSCCKIANIFSRWHAIRGWTVLRFHQPTALELDAGDTWRYKFTLWWLSQMGMSMLVDNETWNFHRASRRWIHFASPSPSTIWEVPC